MKHTLILILADDTGWCIGLTDEQACHTESIHLPEEPSPEDVAQALVDHLSRRDSPGTLQGEEESPVVPVKPRVAIPGVVLGVPSGWCMCGTVPVPELPPRQRRTAMLFALEEKLPIPVEQVVADFIVDGDTALGIAVEMDRLRGLIDALEEQGVPVDVVCPTALMALQDLTRSEQPPASSLVWKDYGGLNLYELDTEQNLKHWRFLPSNAEDEATGEQTSNADLNDISDEWVERSLATDHVKPQAIVCDMVVSALKTVKRIHEGRTEPLINLRRDALNVSDRLRKVRGHVFAVILAAAVMLLALTGVSMWRAQAYQQADDRYDAAVTSLYHETFGDQPRPTSVRRRLNTRLRELKGLAGQQFDDVQSTEKTSALWLLHDLLERIPSDQRLCVLDMKIEHDYLTIAGQARSHSDADRIAASLRRDGRFDVDPPSTSNLKDGGVSFTLHCRPIDIVHPEPSSPPSDTEHSSSLVVTTEGSSGAGEVAP